MTLQNVAFQLGLRVDGEPISGCTYNWETHLNRDIWSFCRKLLGMVLEESDMQGCTIKLTWFRSAFPTLDVDAFDEIVAHHTHAYILQLLSGFFMLDASASRVSLKSLPFFRDFSEAGRLSWGSTVLATLYRQLCCCVKYNVTNIFGYLAFLQS